MSEIQAVGPEHADCTAQITVLRRELVQHTEELRQAREELESLRSHMDEGLRRERESADERLGWVQSLVRAALDVGLDHLTTREQVLLDACMQVLLDELKIPASDDSGEVQPDA